jgi:polyisoprenoid-binding protein YceI
MATTRWNIDAAHSGVHFSVRHMVFAKVRGRFGSFSGAVEVEDGNFANASVEASIDAASIDTGTPQRDTHLRSADFFDAEKFPQLLFRSKRIEAAGDNRYRVVGELTIRGVTREVSLDVEATGKGVDPWGNERLGFSASTSLDRKDFGLNWNQALETGGVLVGDRVDVELEIQAVKAAAAKAA